MGTLSENEKFLYKIDDLDIDAESIFEEYPPVWNEENKLMSYNNELCCINRLWRRGRDSNPRYA